jgi:hypothetical protein
MKPGAIELNKMFLFEYSTVQLLINESIADLVSEYVDLPDLDLEEKVLEMKITRPDPF